MYADILFLTEFIRDYLVLYAVSKIAQRSARPKKLIAGACVGAAFSTLAAIFLPVDHLLFNFFYGLFLCAAMLKAAFQPNTKGDFFHLLLCTYASAFILGGIISFVNSRFPKVPSALIFLTAYLLFRGGFYLVSFLRQRIGKYCTARIVLSDEIKTLTALVDTGNLLKDEKSGLPVSIINESELALPLSEYDFHDVAFHSLGCENGILKVMYVPYLYIDYKGTEKIVQNAPVGISRYPLSPTGAYQMIISPEILTN